MGEVHPRLTLGASYSSKIYMSEFDDYDELFAEDGDFDVPANFTLGATFKATPKLKVSFDFQQIQYEDVSSISNAGPVPTPAGPGLPPGGGLLGTDNGLGFGWEDINIYRLAAEYAYDSQWIFRAGYSWNDQPIPDEPGAVQYPGACHGRAAYDRWALVSCRTSRVSGTLPTCMPSRRGQKFADGIRRAGFHQDAPGLVRRELLVQVLIALLSSVKKAAVPRPFLLPVAAVFPCRLRIISKPARHGSYPGSGILTTSVGAVS